jgi:hypothetical protein
MPNKIATAPPIYPNLPTEDSPSDEPAQNFRLKQIRDIRDYLENEAEIRSRLRRRYKSIYNTFFYLSTTTGVIAMGAGTGSVVALSTGIGALVALPLGIASI